MKDYVITMNYSELKDDLNNLYKNPPSRMAYIADMIEYETNISVPDDIWSIIGDMDGEYGGMGFITYYKKIIIECKKDLKDIVYDMGRIHNLKKHKRCRKLQKKITKNVDLKKFKLYNKIRSKLFLLKEK